MSSYPIKIKVLLLIALQTFGLVNLFSQEKKWIRKGNKAYQTEDYNASEIDYRKALEKNTNSFDAKFNLADALYKQEKFEEAQKQFEKLTYYETSKENKAKAFHNLGNSLFQTQQLEPSIEAYKNALKNNPKDNESRYNLAYAKHLLKKQQQQNKKQDKDNKDKNKEEEQKDQGKDQGKDQEKKKEEEKNKNQKDKKDQKQKDQNKKPEKQEEKKQKKQQIPKEKADQMLKALENDEKDLQKKLKMQQVKGQKIPVEKDW